MDHAGDQSFGALLRRYRAAAGLSQEALAERSGLSARALSDLERGVRRAPYRQTVARLADALGLTAPDRAHLEAAITRRRSRRPDAPVPQPTAAIGLPHPLIGRDTELALIGRHLRRVATHLLTITGPGGVGKTHLALAVAAAQAGSYAAGMLFVPLAPVGDHALVGPGIARALGLREGGRRALRERLVMALRDQHLLLVLDNFEHVVAAAPLVGELQAACPRLALLVTSRVALGLPGEQVIALDPLPYPAPGLSPDLAALVGYSAVALFAARAAAHQPGFALTAANAADVAAICRRLDGLPLALELAAARIGTLPPSALLARLVNRLDLELGAAGELPARQRTLRVSLAWSYDLLVPAEQSLFRRLAVFAGGGTLPAIAAVHEALQRQRAGVGLPATLPVLDDLASLTAKSLVQRQLDREEPRFALLATVRDYALERLTASGERAAAERAHAAAYLALAEEAAPGLRGPEQAAWLARLDADLDNLRAALRWASESGETGLGLRLATALRLFWHQHGHLTEGRAWLEGFLASAQGAAASDAGPQAAASLVAGVLAYYQGDYERAATLHGDALSFARRAADEALVAGALGNLGLVALQRGDYRRAGHLLEECLALQRRLGDLPGIANSLNNLGVVARDQGDLARAAAFHAEGLERQRKLGDTRGIAQALANLGAVARHAGDLDRARALLIEALALRRGLGSARGIADTLQELAKVALATGRAEEAAVLLTEGLASYQRVEDLVGIAACLETLAATWRVQGGRDAGAARLAGAASALRVLAGTIVPPVARPAYEGLLRDLRDVLGPPAFACAWREGERLSPEEALTLAGGV